MTNERLFETEVSQEEYDQMQDKFVQIPPGASGVPAEGDSIYLTVEAGVAEWKKPGKSLTVPLTVTEDGMNKGKVVEWYPGVEKAAMGVTKKALKAFGIEAKVLRNVNGKVQIAPMGFAGARARALFRREMTNNNNLIAKLDSTQFLPVGAQSQTRDAGI